MSTNGLAAPGSSTYDSNTLHVGDGTWDSQRDVFLLPNLVGFNFATMQYNGMRNRFRSLAEYHNLIGAHGIIAAITFLFIVPFAILIARFYHRNRRLALRLHIWMQILTFFFTTVVFVLGWFAVGAARSLTNPHHGIGLALYVMISFQILFGALVHHVEKKKIRHRIPLKLMLHQWLGRSIALLGIAQVALGITLYGSPKAVFIVYALWVFVLLLIYFVLSYRQRPPLIIDERGSYTSGSRTDLTPDRPEHTGRLGKIAAGLGGAGVLAALARRRSRSRSRTRTDGVSSHRPSSRPSSRPNSRPSSSHGNEKYSAQGRKDHTWRDRILASMAGIGALAAARKIFRGRQEDDAGSDYSHQPLSGGAHSATETDVSRIEEGRYRPTTPTRLSVGASALPVPGSAAAVSSSRPPRHNTAAGGSIQSYESYDSYLESPGREKRKTHTVRDGIIALGVAGYLRHMWNERKNKKDELRVEELRRKDRENERLARKSSNKRRYTGDGMPRPSRRHGSITESEMTPLGGSNPELSLQGFGRPSGPTTPDVTAANTAANAGNMLTAPPQHLPATVRVDSSDSEAFSHVGASKGSFRHSTEAAVAAGVAGTAVGAAAGAAAGRHRRSSSHRRESSNGTSLESSGPRASVQVKMHNDGRHITLRRLDAQEREAERRRRGARTGRVSSFSSLGGTGPSDNEQWRRVERREAEQAAQMRADAIAAGAAQHDVLPAPSSQLPIPPPHAAHGVATLPGPPPGVPPAASYPVVMPHSSAPAGQLNAYPMSAPPPIGSSIMTPSPSGLAPPPPLAGSIPMTGSPQGAYGSPGGAYGSPGSVFGSGPSNVDSRAESNRRRRRAERARMAAERERTGGTRVDFT